MQSAGYAALEIIPSFKGTEGYLNKSMTPILSRSGTKGGRIFGDSAGMAMSSRFTAHAKRAAILAGGIVGGVGALGIKFAKDSLEGFEDHLRVVKVTQSTIKATGGVANVTARQVGRMSDALERQTGVDGDIIQSGGNMLLTFKNVRNEAGKNNDIYTQSLGILTDMSTAMGTDAKSSAIQLGKALNDPVKGISALSRVGVTFDKQQQDQIKNFVEQGKVASAQKVILGELSSEFGGAAHAQRNMADQVTVAYHSLQDEVGKFLLPKVRDFEHFLAKDGIPAAEHYFRVFEKRGVPAIHDLLENARPLANSILPAASTAFHDIAGFLEDAAPYAKKTIDAFNSLPDWAQKSVVLGVGAGVLAKKAGVLGVGTKVLTGGGKGGLLSSIKGTPADPVWVAVVNGGVPTTGIPEKGAKLGTLEKFKRVVPLYTLQGALLGAIAIEGAEGDKRGIKSIGDFGRNIVQAQTAPTTGGSGPRTANTVLAVTTPGTRYFDAKTGKFFTAGGPNDPTMRKLKAASDASDSLRQHLGQASTALDLVSRHGSQTFGGLSGKIDATANRTSILDRRLRGLPATVRTELSLDDRAARRRLAAFRAEAQKSLDLEIAGPHMGRPGDRQSALDGVRR